MRLLLCLVSLVVVDRPLLAGDWSQFRGGTAGRLAEVVHPLEWSEETNVAWKVPVSGSGWSSPVVAAGRVFLTAAEAANGARPAGMSAGVASMRSFRKAKPVSHRYVVHCLDLSSGQTLWTKVVGESVPPVVHPSNTYATESPATDGRLVFTFFATTGHLTAWSLDGEEMWSHQLGAHKFGNGFGSGSSLALADGRVFVQNDNDESSFVSAFDAASGELLWRQDRPAKTSWSSPLIWQTESETVLVVCGAGVVTGYAPEDGSTVWSVREIESAFSASPALDAERICFGKSGPMSAGPLVALPAGQRGEIALSDKFEAEQLAWSRTKSGPGMASPVITGGLLYVAGSRGILNVYDAATGERVYRTRVPGMATVAASLWAAEDRVFILDESGKTFVISVGDEFALERSNQLEGLFWSTPAVAGESLLVRSATDLYCIRDSNTREQ